MTTKKYISLGIIGCGRIASFHLDAIADLTGIKLIAFCDPNKTNLDKFSTKYQVPGYTDLKTMLTTEKLDLVAICTPSGLHPELSFIAAEHGCHIVTEKPMATNFADGCKMIEVAKQNNVQLFVVKQNRNNSTIKAVKDIITQGYFGRIYLVQANVFWCREQSYYDQAAWRGTYKYDGGALMNQASHYVDLLYWLIGPVTKIQAMGATLARKIEAEDTIVLNLTWDNKALGSVAVTTLTYAEDYEGSISIFGETGSIKIGGKALNKIEYHNFANDPKVDWNKLSYETDSVYGFGHKDFYVNVIDVLLNNAKPATDGQEGIRSLEIISAAYLGCRDNECIKLPL